MHLFFDLYYALCCLIHVVRLKMLIDDDDVDE